MAKIKIVKPVSRSSARSSLAPAKPALKKLRPSGKSDDSFFEQVYAVVRQIPAGRVTSYGAIAASLGARSSARMVGWAMNNSHQHYVKVPAHRVVNRNGMLTGKHHFPDESQMQRLLEKENVRIVNDTVVDFDKLFWDPATGL